MTTIEEIIWMDAAAGETNIEVLNLVKETGEPHCLFVKTVSYGRVEYEDDDAIILVQNSSIDEKRDYIAIPKGWVKERNVLKRYAE